MPTIRRFYIYLVAAASLAILVAGLIGAGDAVVELLLGSGALPSTYRETIATNVAEILVALPLWILHWGWAQRLAQRDPAERAATLRRLYLYATLGALLLALGRFASDLVDAAMGIVLGTTDGTNGIAIVRALWELAVVAAFWAYTFRIAGADRAAAGETGGSATLRRWYAYSAQFVALLAGLAGAETLLETLLVNLLGRPAIGGAAGAVANGAALTLVALGIWLFHRRWTARSWFAGDDRHSTLRAVYGFGIVAVAVAETLASAGRILYWCLARLLGVPQPSGQPADAVLALSGAVATGIVFAAAWALVQRELARDAAGAPVGRQAGVRRLYRHLVALVALATLTSGAMLLLWALVDQFAGPGALTTVADFRDRLSLAVTLLVVGLPVWLLFWRPNVAPEDRLALSRRLYLFASLLGSVLAGLGSGVWLASQLLKLLLAAGSPQPAVEIGHALALVVVAAAVAAYHARVLWEDLAFRAAHGRPAPEAAPAGLPGAGVPGRIVVEISGATEEQVRIALGALPAGATFQLEAR